eukprot:gene3176-13191_t
MALHQALTDLETVKRQLKQPFMAKASVEAQIDGISAGLRMKSQHPTGSSLNAVMVAAAFSRSSSYEAPSSAEGQLQTSSGSVTRGLTPATGSTAVLHGSHRHDPFSIAPRELADKESDMVCSTSQPWASCS